MLEKLAILILIFFATSAKADFMTGYILGSSSCSCPTIAEKDKEIQKLREELRSSEDYGEALMTMIKKYQRERINYASLSLKVSNSTPLKKYWGL